ncbi:glycosyltransferase [Glaciibacter psychrotolerans]|uniref:UDP-N-acetylglucosamine transferase subunit ALG13 n=1 Tax=Glaciibacter psychrotolerans TaxID=670054 RepID=A0A7Z0EHM7_9MICO|nr:UDP-N-acetylglucosamine transferase subunit ALG13 [Leifsonia psychrotolerans]
MSPHTVVVSAGTYHLPFNRLVDWMEPWVAAHPSVRVIMQHGPSRPLVGAENHAILAYPELLALCAAADAIVLQGGAGGVMDMRALARIPIVVPRVPIDDEVVDDHQLLFTNRVAELGVIVRAITREALWEHLDSVLAGTLDTHARAVDPTPGVANLCALLAQPPARLNFATRMRRLGRSASGIVRRQ